MRWRGWVLVAAWSCLGAEQAAAGAWTQPQGRLWLKIGGSFGFADEKFANGQIDAAKTYPDGTPVVAGDRIPFDFVTAGRYRYQSYSVEGSYGVTDYLEVSTTVPFLHTRFDNDNNEVEPGAGIGDLRWGVGLRLLQSERGVVSLAGEWKLPTADVPRSVFAQPLGEGQHDLTVWVHGGWSLWPLGWAQVGVGHRWRRENSELGFDPGNEWHLRAEFGWQLSRAVAFKAGVEGLEGKPWTTSFFGFRQEIGTRRLWSAAPSLIVSLGSWGARSMSAELGGAIALAGEDLPAVRELRLAWMVHLGN